jgi:hypothetical protein
MEQGACVRRHPASDLLERDPSDASDLFGDERNVDWLVALPAVGDRSEVGTVGLQDDPLERDRGDGTAHGLSSVRTTSCV